VKKIIEDGQMEISYAIRMSVRAVNTLSYLHSFDRKEISEISLKENLSSLAKEKSSLTIATNLRSKRSRDYLRFVVYRILRCDSIMIHESLFKVEDFDSE